MSSPKKPSQPRVKKPSASPRASHPPPSPDREPRAGKAPGRRLAKPPTKPSAAKPAKPRRTRKPKAAPASPKPLEQAGPKPDALAAEPPSPWDLPPHVAAELITSPLAAARFAWRLVADLCSDRPEPLAMRRQIVVDVLRHEAEQAFGHLTTDKRAAPELERFLRLHIAQMREGVGFDDFPPRKEEEATEHEDGILARDARFARYLERLGNLGKAAAEQLRASAKERAWKFQQATSEPNEKNPRGAIWALWAAPDESPPGSRFARLLAIVLWNDVVASWIKNSASLVYPIAQQTTRIHSRTTKVIEQDQHLFHHFQNGESHPIKRIEPLELPAMELAVLDVMLRRGLTLLGSVTAHRLLRWEITEGHNRVRRREVDARALHIDGGWSALAEKLELQGRKAAEDIHAIVVAQAHSCFRFSGGAYGNLLSYTVEPSVGRRKGFARIILGDALLPDFLFEIRAKMGHTSRSAREIQRLVPVVDLPPLIGRPNEHGQQASLSMAVVTELRHRAAELFEQGGILLASERWRELAELAGLPVSMIDQVLDRWTQDGDDGPAFLEKTDPNRFTLAATHSAARAFLLEAGRREVEGSEAGKRSADGRSQQGKNAGKK